MRNERHLAIESVKKAEKDKKITEDERFKADDLLQKLTGQYIKLIDEVLAAKEKEIMTE